MANQTTTVSPPTWQLPYLQYGLAQARDQYQQGGTPVVPFSPYSEEALQGTADRATAGSPLVNAAQQYAQTSLQGGFLGSNPYLDRTFEKARLATQGGLASEFARSGRNVGASEGLRSQQLNDLATQIYGGAYNQERQLQQGVLGSVVPLANQDYVDLAQLRGAGTDVEGLAREYANQPANALDQYLGRVTGNFGSTTTQPLYRNSGAAAIGGALAGYGATNGSPFGTILGGLAGYYGG